MLSPILSPDTFGFHEVPKIHFEDDSLIILYKPPSWFVHPPENPKFRRGLRRRTCVQWLMDTYSIKAFPAHRLDAATDGLLIFGKTKEATSQLNLQFRNHEVDKTYHAIVRGWMKEKSAAITLDLELDSTGDLVACETQYKTLSQIELPYSVHNKFPTTRYALLEVKPITGRWHQFRRHMNRVSHPIIGDREHGDSHHNRFFRDQLQIDGLCLSAVKISFRHPVSQEILCYESPRSEKWLKADQLFDFSHFKYSEINFS
jgi:tRNA pseudouridine65 synthase